ncbi:MAG: hypothetical protein ABIH85_07525, partial [Candidatus Omnitrophota bacterium]
MQILFKNKNSMIIKIMLIFALLFSSAINVYGESFCDNLSPGFVYSQEMMTVDDFIFSESILSENYFLYFVLLTHKTIIKEKQTVDILLNRLNGFQFWEKFKYKKYLKKNFVSVNNNILQINLKDNSLVRVIPLSE